MKKKWIAICICLLVVVGIVLAAWQSRRGVSEENILQASSVVEAQQQEAAMLLVSDAVEPEASDTDDAGYSDEETNKSDLSGKADNGSSEEATEDNTKQDDESIGKYGRILFIGDSRTIDMFADSDDDIRAVTHDGVAVYGGHGKGLDFMTEAVEEYGWDNFDTLVTWMGANERGDFDSYGPYYDSVLAKGKTLVVCTVGPTDNDTIEGAGIYLYSNEQMQGFNKDLVEWAQSKGVRVIDLYRYIVDNSDITIDAEDGIHYLPRPTTKLWEHILAVLEVGS